MSLTNEQKREHFERAVAMDGGTYAVDDVIEMVKAGNAQFWERGDGMVVTEIRSYPRRRVLNYWLIAGRLHDCLALEADIEAWAVAEGCASATAAGPRKWRNVVEKRGWREDLPHYWKPLTPEGETHG